MRVHIITAALSFLLFACATRPDALPAASVSTEQYLEHDCSHLLKEDERISASLRDAEFLQAGQANNDAATVGLAVVVFPPALMALRGNRGVAAEVTRLRGERQAITHALAKKKCVLPEK